MPITPKVLAFAGSTREGSFNKKLVRVAAEAARAAGSEVTLLDLRELDLPMYDGDLEATKGLPGGGRKLKDLMLAHHGFLISAPEYNSSISAVLKNAIDWASRPVPGEKPLECFDGKIAALMSASPGALGGLRMLVHLRAILENIGTIVLPKQVAISKANEAFDANGSLKDAAQQKKIQQLCAELTEVIRKLKS
jgi:NAD(P)H-dependent FMN reductase